MAEKNNFDNLDKLLNTLKNIENIKPQMEKAVRQQTLFVQGNAKELCPAKTGILRMSIRTGMAIKDQGSTIEGIVYTNLDYAPYVEFGTGPVGAQNHEGISPDIDPVYSQTGWTYYDSVNERFVRTKGQPAQPFMYPALKNNEKKIKRNLKVAFKEAIEEASK